LSRTPRNDLATLQHKNITFSRLEVTLFIADKFSEHAKSTLRAKLDYSAERIRFGVVTLEMWMAFSIVVVQFICFLETTVSTSNSIGAVLYFAEVMASCSTSVDTPAR